MYNALANFTVKTERLFIRPVVAGDLSAVYNMHREDVVNKYLPYETWHDWDAAKDWFARVQHRRLEESSQQYVLERRRDKKVIGSCLVFNLDNANRSLELGYVLSKGVWRQGYMNEAITEFLLALKSEVGVKHVTACIQGGNQASRALIAKLGFEHTRIKIEEAGTKLDVYRLAL